MADIEQKVTIKTIAQELGVSTGTVHRAVYGKKGVSKQRQEQILELCARRGYQTNTAASALKRGPVRIVAAFPGPDQKNRYFYANVWRGFRRCLSELKGYNLEVVELPYYHDAAHSQSTLLADCYQRYGGDIDGLITIGHFDAACKRVVQTYSGGGIPVFLACDDTSDCGRMACVQSNYDLTGRVVAELLESQLRPGGTVLLCAGDVLIPSHCETVRGFEAYLDETAADLKMVKLNGYENEQELRSRLRKELAIREEIVGAFSVSARLSVVLAEEIAALGLEDRIRVVASDLFEQTIADMKTGRVKNIIFKDPAQQAYLATRIMADFVLKAIRPDEAVTYVQSRIIFKSSLQSYCQ